MPINSKQKGNRGELECVKILNERFEEGGFARVPSSGAWGGGQNRELRENMSIEQKLTLVADIMTPPEFCYIIEHKSYAEIDFWELFNESSDLNKWAEQVSGDADFVGKDPMLIMKFNRHKRLVMIRHQTPHVKFIWFDAQGRDWYCSWLEDLLAAPNSLFFSGKGCIDIK